MVRHFQILHYTLLKFSTRNTASRSPIHTTYHPSSTTQSSSSPPFTAQWPDGRILPPRPIPLRGPLTLAPTQLFYTNPRHLSPFHLRAWPVPCSHPVPRRSRTLPTHPAASSGCVSSAHFPLTINVPLSKRSSTVEPRLPTNPLEREIF